MILNVSGSNEQLAISPERLIVAGYTARDEAAVAEHIAELEAIGVPRPAGVPAFYDLDPALLTTDGVIEVDGPSTSGEVEPVLVRHGGRYFLAVGSDHTDRDLERADIAASKAACPKPLGETVVEIGTGMSTLDWDSLTAVSSVDGWTYQKGAVATLRHPADLLERMAAAVGEISGDLVLFCGTMPLLRSEFTYGGYWRMHLELPAGTLLAHAYETKRRSL
ncbi:DUF2848 family protein [Streptosporangium sp. NPDC051023]|uniref:DUF2848 family protein n=1 Tax=Streptosporangium sp. NPDC051023 TaxID=3155410 RepID=UPI00344EDD0B